MVAYALAGSMLRDITTEPLGFGKDGKPVYLKDVWPTPKEVDAAVLAAVSSECSSPPMPTSSRVTRSGRRSADSAAGMTYGWDDASTYVRQPPYFAGMTRQPAGDIADIKGARVLALLGDQHHDRPHLARRQHRQDQPGR